MQANQQISRVFARRVARGAFSLSPEDTSTDAFGSNIPSSTGAAVATVGIQPPIFDDSQGGSAVGDSGTRTNNGLGPMIDESVEMMMAGEDDQHGAQEGGNLAPPLRAAPAAGVPASGALDGSGDNVYSGRE